MTDSAVLQLSAEQALEQGLRMAVDCQRSGRLADAERLYVEILQLQPTHPDANHNLGVLHTQAGDFEAGLPYLFAAIEADPTTSQYWLSYIEALILADRKDDARQVLEHARRHGLEGAGVDALAARLQGKSGKKPNQAGTTKQDKVGQCNEPLKREIEALIALFNRGLYAEGEALAGNMTARFPRFGFGWKVLGAMLKSQGRSAEALAPLKTAAELLPADPETQSNLGTALGELRFWAEAEACHRRAVALQPKFANGHFNLGLALQAQGNFPEAEHSFRRASELKSDWAECHFNLAGSLQAQGKLPEAVASYRRALNVDPLLAEAHNNLACVLKDQHLYAESEIHYRRALDSNAELSEAHNNLGLLLDAQGRHEEAEACIRRALDIRPDYSEAHNNLGIVLKHRGREHDAELCYRRALEIDPQFIEALYNLANCLSDRENHGDAEQSYRRALQLDPNYAPAHNNLGNLLEKLHRSKEAEIHHRRALELNPEYVDAHCNLGNSLRGQGKLAEAEASYRRALAIKPQFADALYNLGIALAEQFKLVEAEASYRYALALKPDHAEAQKNLGNTLKEQGRFVEAEACYRRALELKPDYAVAQSNLLFDSNYTADRPVAACLEEARRYGAMVDRLAARKFSAWPCNSTPQRLRVGMVSGDFHSHPVGFFLEALLNRIDTSRIELVAYTAHFEADDLTARIKPKFAAWTSIADLSDAAAAQSIHADGLHVLLDLSGHTARNRLSMFACKPAPVQASWLGYFATTGVKQMDYLLGDPYVTPANEADHFTESVWRLPETYLCFTPPDVELAVAELPALSTGNVTFGCFNSLTKMTDAVVASWSHVLRALPQSRLFLKTRQLNDAATCVKTRERFAAHGIDAQRLLLEGGSPRAELLAAYHRVDIALDPFPYPGGTTSVEGLWMGVPVITRKGDRFVSHVGETIAHNAGLSDWIANGEEDYVAKAIAAASDLRRLATLRAGLRARVLTSPVFDAARFARNFEAALWGMWQNRRPRQQDNRP